MHPNHLYQGCHENYDIMHVFPEWFACTKKESLSTYAGSISDFWKKPNALQIFE